MKLINRPEIDGLRAIAVSAVILYHAQITVFGHQPFQGGFIGVDIFFVISGYLITSIILKELVTTGSFSFKHFYERRVRRILPALLFVMTVSLPFAWMYLLPISFIDFSKSILYSLGFSSNFYFHYSGQEYGAESGLLKPFLHTWSLSVEEQFYILFPIVLLIIFKYFRRNLIYVLILGFIVSLGLADWGSRNHPSFNFYVLPTRGWELLAGSILAYFEITKGHRSDNKTLNLISPTIGLLLISHSIIFFDKDTFHPSFYTLSPIIGVCLIIWFSNSNEIITKILSTKLFVGIGLISYSLYLWHYPIFAFATITDFFENNAVKLSSGFIVIFLSIFSYYIIEKPFRNKKYTFKFIFTLIVISFTFLVTFNYYVINNDGIKTRLPEIFQNKLRERNVNFFQKDNTQKVVLLGDSHSGALEFNLNEEIKKNDLSLFRLFTEMYLKDFNIINRKTQKKRDNYFKRNINIDNFLEENLNLIVVFHQRWSAIFLETLYDNEEGYKDNSKLITSIYLEPINIKTSSLQQRQRYIREGLISQINKIINQGHKLVLVYPVPEMWFDPQKLLYKKYLFEKNLFENSVPVLSDSYEAYKKRNKLIFEILDSVQSPNIYRVYPHKSFCDKQIENRCVANDNKNIYYFDDDHLSIKGSRFVVNDIMRKIEQIEPD
ncbi:acyltransferase family protein [Candidatus Pelagibacter sp.]|nr:acyltransferase family protein [Candidatus Pelagibacter sp.]